MVITAQNIHQKPGYKQTEVGVIPEDWEVKKLSEITEVVMGQSPAGTSYNRDGYGYPLINGPTEFTDRHPIKIQWTNQPTKFCKKNDILLCVRGSSTGRINIANDDYCIGRGIAAIRAKTEVDTRYITFQVICSVINILALTSGSTFPNIDGKSIRSIKVPLPPLPEQRAIAAALSDVDALITSMDRLIAKKRDIKQATMQQLLMGKMRLPGFSKELKPSYKQTEVGVIPDDWEVHTLGDEIDQLEAGVSVNSVDEEFHVYAHEQAILKTSAVSNGYFFPHENKKIAPREIKKAKLNPCVDSIIISRMNTPDLVGECGYVDKDYPNLFLPDRLWMTRFKRGSKINVKWLSYLLSYRGYKVKIKEAATGTSGSMKNISKDSLLSINIPFPIHEEQIAIATVLSDMDAEIAALEQKRNKIRALKQGMMQELLTGKTRLV